MAKTELLASTKVYNAHAAVALNVVLDLRLADKTCEQRISCINNVIVASVDVAVAVKKELIDQSSSGTS
jgi:hypothetical protein